MQRPMVLAFVLCEQFIVEENTHNVTLVNCFNQRTVVKTPPEPFSFVVFAQLVGGQGDMSMGFTIERLDTMGIVYERFNQVRFLGPLQEMRVSARVMNCVLPNVGYYQVSLLAEGETIALRKLHIKLRENEP